MNIFTGEEKPRCRFNEAMMESNVLTDELCEKIRTINGFVRENDFSVQTLIEQCQNLVQLNVNMLKTMYRGNQDTAGKLESWIENYMILKRKTEQGAEIYERELKKSRNIENECKDQIKNLCEMINRLNSDICEERQLIEKYKKSFQFIYTNLETLDDRFKLVIEMANQKVSIAEGKLHDLVIKCETLQNSPSGSTKKRSISRKLSKSLFKLKRHQSETNEKIANYID